MFFIPKVFFIKNLSTEKKFLFHGNLLFLNPFKVISIKVCAELGAINKIYIFLKIPQYFTKVKNYKKRAETS